MRRTQASAFQLRPGDTGRYPQDIMMILLLLCFILAGKPHIIHTEAVNGALIITNHMQTVPPASWVAGMASRHTVLAEQ